MKTRLFDTVHKGQPYSLVSIKRDDACREIGVTVSIHQSEDSLCPHADAQDSVEGGGSTAALNMTQHCHSSVQTQFLRHQVFHIGARDWLVFSVSSTFSHQDNGHSLTTLTILDEAKQKQ